MLSNKDIPTAYGTRFLPIYFNEIKKEEREKIEHEVDYAIQKKNQMESGKNDSANARKLDDLFTGIREPKREQPDAEWKADSID